VLIVKKTRSCCADFVRLRSNRQSGVTLIEVLITLLVLSVGLLGLAALQGFSLQAGQVSYLRTQATNLAYEVADHARAHRAEVAGCNPGSSFTSGLARIETRAAQVLPQGDLETTIDIQGACNNNLGIEFSVTVSWLDDREAGEEAEFAITTQI